MAAADFVVVAHIAFLAYLVAGGFLALRRFAWIWPHLGVLIWSVTVTLTGATCPLTTLEKWLLDKGGAVPYEGSFIEHYLHGTLFPGRYEVAVGVGAWAVALVSYAIAVARRRHAAGAAPAGAPSGHTALDRARSGDVAPAPEPAPGPRPAS